MVYTDGAFIRNNTYVKGRAMPPENMKGLGTDWLIIEDLVCRITATPWYNVGTGHATGESVDMSLYDDLQKLSGQEPIAERETHPWGIVKLYTPDVEPGDWDKHPWTLVTETSDDGPIFHECSHDEAYALFERPWKVGQLKT